MLSLADVERENVTWLWPGRIPLGKITVMDGDPGLGKSTVLLDLSARLSLGREMPDGTVPECGAASVVLLTAEDGLGDTVRPRLEAAGADLARVVALTAVSDRPPSIADLAEIESAIQDCDARLLVIDPLMAFLPGEVNSFRDQDIRRILAPLAALLDRLGTACVVLRHLNKLGGGSPLYRGGGSIGIIGAARSGLLVAPDPENESRRVLASIKSNLCLTPSALAFRLEDDGSGVARVVWLGSSDHSAAALLAQPTEPEERSAREQAKEFLHELLSPGRLPVREVKAEQKAAGIADRTLDRAKRELGVIPEREGYGAKGVWYWRLPHPIPRQSAHTAPLLTGGAQSSESAIVALNGQTGTPDIRDPKSGLRLLDAYTLVEPDEELPF